MAKSKQAILAIDALNFRRLEELDNEIQRKQSMRSVLRELVSERIVVKPAIFNLTPFERYVQYVRENSTSFTCHHRRFYWTICAGCKRNQSEASAKAEYYRPRILAILGMKESELK